MSRRLVWLLPVLTVAVASVMVVYSWGTEDQEGVEIFFALAFVAYATVGALIASRHPRNPVGWLFAAIGLLSAATELAYAYARHEVEEAGGLSPAATAAAWVSDWLGNPGFVALVLLLLLFPDGHFRTRRWRFVGTAAVLLAVTWAAALALEPRPLLDLPTVSNPLGVEAADEVLGVVGTGTQIGFFLLVPVGVASVVVRFRTANIEERQRIKWLAMAGGYAIVAVIAVAVTGAFTDTDTGLGDLVTALLIASAITAFPLAAGIAILRNRLYDIDVVIKRTLVYGALTATLVAAYLGSVLAFRLLLDPLAGESDLSVAASTLAVAALFRPLRSRIQAVVNRRFYRERYDAALTMVGFTTRLRDQIDLDTLGSDLKTVVNDTMQPDHVSLWLRSTR
ncbi:MAG: hypothetical protein M4D85_00810 [Actinomycetota bacterium]|nr:hypothetical protein [Actinomycetota bacterium]MDQ3663750.1 hypothetical protein [Actinomycetota bacterium]